MKRIVFCLIQCLLEHIICFPIYLVERLRYHRHKESNNESNDNVVHSKEDDK
jgi:hypothetical protein